MMGDLHIVARSIGGGNLPGQRLQRRTYAIQIDLRLAKIHSKKSQAVTKLTAQESIHDVSGKKNAHRIQKSVPLVISNNK